MLHRQGTIFSRWRTTASVALRASSTSFVAPTMATSSPGEMVGPASRREKDAVSVNCPIVNLFFVRRHTVRRVLSTCGRAFPEMGIALVTYKMGWAGFKAFCMWHLKQRSIGTVWQRSPIEPIRELGKRCYTRCWTSASPVECPCFSRCSSIAERGSSKCWYGHDSGGLGFLLVRLCLPPSPCSMGAQPVRMAGAPPATQIQCRSPLVRHSQVARLVWLTPSR